MAFAVAKSTIEGSAIYVRKKYKLISNATNDPLESEPFLQSSQTQPFALGFRFRSLAKRGAERLGNYPLNYNGFQLAQLGFGEDEDIILRGLAMAFKGHFLLWSTGHIGTRIIKAIND